MWLPDRCAEEIDAALKNNKFRQIDRLLENVFKNGPSGQSFKDAAKVCPVCKKELVNRALPYLELVINSCADGHGAWMHPKACTELWAVIADHIAGRARKRKILLTVLSLFCLLLLFDILTGTRALQHNAGGSSPRTIKESLIGLNYWPMRDTSSYALPLKETSIGDIEDLYYFKLLTDHLDIILSNRMNMAAALVTKRPAREYGDIYALFYEQQSLAAESLRKIEPPEKLKAVHEKIHHAVLMQIRFYADYAEEKTRFPETTLEDFHRHEVLIKSSKKFEEAWRELQTLFPGMDEKTSLALESRLNWANAAPFQQ